MFWIGLALIPLMLGGASTCGDADVRQSLVWQEGVAYAGEPYVISIQLTNADCYHDASLQAYCTSGDSPTPGATFCHFGPVIEPLGDGLYNLTLVPGTIWGARKVWPPALRPGVSLSESYFQGDNALHIVYDGVELPGSPFMLLLMPAKDISVTRSALNLLTPARGVAGVQFVMARFYQASDVFSNWLRGEDLINNIEVEVVSVDPTAQAWIQKQWWGTNWWIDILMLSEMAGVYKVYAYYVHNDGNKEPLRIQSNTTAYEVLATVKPGPLVVENIAAEVSATTIRAGSPLNVKVLTVDAYLNLTPLLQPSAYNYLKDYSIADQNTSLIQVYMKKDLNYLPHMCTMADVQLGAVHIACAVQQAGMYNLTIVYEDDQMSLMILQHNLAVIAGKSDLLQSNVTYPSIIRAGDSSCVNVDLRDAFGNAALADDHVTLSGQLYKNTTNEYMQLNQVYQNNQSCLLLQQTKAGNYIVEVQFNGAHWLDVPVSVLHASDLDAGRFQVQGFGMGVPFSTSHSGENYTAYIEAGQKYHMTVVAFDRYGNLFNSPHAPYSINFVGPETERAQGISDYKQDIGSTEIWYTLFSSGEYVIIVHYLQQLVYQGLVTVNPGNAVPEATYMEIPSVVHSGEELHVVIKLYDAFNNTVIIPSGVVVVVRNYTGGTDLSYNALLVDHFYRMTTTLTRAGMHLVSSYAMGRFLGLAPAVLTVQASNPATLSCQFQGPDEQGIITSNVTVTDGFGNLVAGQNVLQMIDVRLDPASVNRRIDLQVLGNYLQFRCRLLQSVDQGNLTIYVLTGRTTLSSAYSWSTPSLVEQVSAKPHWLVATIVAMSVCMCVSAILVLAGMVSRLSWC